MRALSMLSATIVATVFSYGVDPRVAFASSYTVNTTSDTHDTTPGNNVCRDSAGRCSLRAAVEESNAHAGYDTITLGSATYVLSKGQLSFSGSGGVDIFGVSRTATRIDGNQMSRVVYVGDAAAGVGFTNLTIQNGKAGDFEPGGGVYLQKGRFNGVQMAISNNQSTSLPGGGIAVGGVMQCSDCTISGNRTATTISGGVQYSGGGIFIYDGGQVWLGNTTISGNTSVRGGGIAGVGLLIMTNGTISSNTALEGGGGLKTMGSNADWWISWSTITKNVANSFGGGETNLGGGILHAGGSLRIGKSIIADNTDGRTPSDTYFSPDCATTTTVGPRGPYAIDLAITSYWDNIYGNIGYVCTAVDVNGGNVGWYDGWGGGSQYWTVGLGPLQDNGGYVLTHALPSTSGAANFAISGNPNAGNAWMFDSLGVDATQAIRHTSDSGSFAVR